jgi:DNA-directed RNA polymerase subunit RPC12/RpoP
MVKVKDLSMLNVSLSMLFGKSPKIKYICGKCNGYNETRISTSSVEMGYPYVICSHCGETNDTGLTLGRLGDEN